MISENMFRLKKNGEPYRGCYCRHPELIENYDKAIADDTQTWDCHHRFEILGFTNKQLKNMGMYYDVEPKDLIFLTHGEHTALHMKGKNNMLGRKHSAETKQKISKSGKGRHWKWGYKNDTKSF